MSTAHVSRRLFLAGASAGGLSLGFHIPFAAAQVAATPGAIPPEVNAWVVVKPDDAVIIRIARSEMGQGTLTGLAQLVELRAFGGMTIDEAAHVLNVSPSTVKRDWRTARAWLTQELGSESPS